MSHKLAVIITAAGNSTRMKKNTNKQFMLIDGREVIKHTIDAFRETGLEMQWVLVIKEEERDHYESVVSEYSDLSITLVGGGDTREESTFRGLQALSKEIEIILTHDGARPLVRPNNILSVYEATKENTAVITAVKVKDTIKRVVEGVVKDTPNRSELMAVQTPQGFHREPFEKAYHHYMDHPTGATDDAGIMEKAGHQVVVIDGDYENIKITTEEDMTVAKAIFERRKHENWKRI